MTESLEKAFQTANFMASLTGQRKLALEEFNQGLIFYQSGASFTIQRELVMVARYTRALSGELAVEEFQRSLS